MNIGWHLWKSNDEMIMICTKILWWYLQCDGNNTYTMGIWWSYDDDYKWEYICKMLMVWIMRHFKFYMMNIYIKYHFKLLFPLPLLVTKRFLLMHFLWCLKMSALKKDLLQSRHTNPTPRCTFLMRAQMAAHEVDGPSLQPSTQHW